jgi:hypothetical protein
MILLLSRVTTYSNSAIGLMAGGQGVLIFGLYLSFLVVVF